jgi:thiol:disulfide interchange protein DsbD
MERKLKRTFLFLIAGTLWAGSLFSQTGKPVGVDAVVQPELLGRGGKGEIRITCRIDEGFHISTPESGLFQVTVPDVKGIAFAEPVLPEGESGPDGLAFYRDGIVVRIPFSIEETVPSGETRVRVQVQVQACEEKTGMCLLPETLEADAVIMVTDTPSGKESESVSPTQTEESPGEGRGEQALYQEEGIAGKVSRALDRGSVLAFLLVFLGGVLTSLTPCVYPMIPITIAVIGGQASGTKLKGFILSLFYVLGIATTFSLLGVIAARSGALFGSFGQHPVTLSVIALIFFLMGLSMLGVFTLQMPSSLATKLQGRKRRGFLGAYITGLVGGLVVSPCISPLLVVILTWVATSGSVLMGVGLLFSFALGLGILFIVIGTFSGILKNLPKSGGWMEVIERGFGVVLVGLALFFIRTLLPGSVYMGLWSLFFVLFGTFIGAFSPLGPGDGGWKKIGKGLGVMAVMAGAFLLFFALAGHFFAGAIQPGVERVEEASLPWVMDDEQGFEQAGLLGKPALMDFYADWCAECREMDKKTFQDTNVLQVLERFVLIRLDMTDVNSPRVQKWKDAYNLIGMPTVIVFQEDGRELSRFAGYKSPEELLQFLNRTGIH